MIVLVPQSARGCTSVDFVLRIGVADAITSSNDAVRLGVDRCVKIILPIVQLRIYAKS